MRQKPITQTAYRHKVLAGRGGEAPSRHNFVESRHKSLDEPGGVSLPTHFVDPPTQNPCPGLEPGSRHIFVELPTQMLWTSRHNFLVVPTQISGRAREWVLSRHKLWISRHKSLDEPGGVFLPTHFCGRALQKAFRAGSGPLGAGAEVHWWEGCQSVGLVCPEGRGGLGGRPVGWVGLRGAMDKTPQWPCHENLRVKKTLVAGKVVP